MSKKSGSRTARLSLNITIVVNLVENVSWRKRKLVAGLPVGERSALAVSTLLPPAGANKADYCSSTFLLRSYGSDDRNNKAFLRLIRLDRPNFRDITACKLKAPLLETRYTANALRYETQVHIA